MTQSNGIPQDSTPTKLGLRLQSTDGKSSVRGVRTPDWQTLTTRDSHRRGLTDLLSHGSTETIPGVSTELNVPWGTSDPQRFSPRECAARISRRVPDRKTYDLIYILQVREICIMCMKYILNLDRVILGEIFRLMF